MTIYQKVSGDPQPGDRITATAIMPHRGATVSVGLDRLTHLAVMSRGSHDDYEVTVERPIEVPTKPGAVVFPYDRAAFAAYFLDEEGDTWLAPNGNEVPREETARRLAAGTHYVAFEGVSDD